MRAGRDGRRVRDAVVVAVIADLFEINVADRGDGRNVLRRDLHKTLHAIAPDSPGVGVRGRWRSTPREHRSDLCKVRAVATGFGVRTEIYGQDDAISQSSHGQRVGIVHDNRGGSGVFPSGPPVDPEGYELFAACSTRTTGIASALFDVNDGDQLACADIETKATQSFKCSVSACVQPRLYEAR